VGLTLWLPPSSDAGREVVDRCRICREFVVYEGEDPRTMERHLRECVKANHDALMAERERQHPEIMKPWDPDFFSWIRRNSDAVLEGRKKP
jgi:hypothetical protein